MKTFTGPPYSYQNSNYYTSQLFYDRWYLLKEDKRLFNPVFTLYEDRPGLINARKTFIELRDPTGYLWSIRYLNSWLHWEVLIKLTWFQEAYGIWLKELKTMIQQEAIQKIRTIAQEDSPQALVAAKYLATAEWEKAASTRGRPSKQELKSELKKAVEEAAVLSEDAERIGLTLIKGGKT